VWTVVFPAIEELIEEYYVMLLEEYKDE
jgi:hypothetical protein